MVDLQAMIDQTSSWVEFGRQYWSLDWSLNPTWTAGIAVLAGLILALWGARLLRTVYVLALMAAGAAIGVYFARRLEVDFLLGLVLGAGLLGLIGHLLYRWLVGLTAGVCAALVVAAVGAPWLVDRAEAFADDLLAGATGQRIFADEIPPTDSPPADIPEGDMAPVVGPQTFVKALASSLWKENRQELTTLGVLIAAAIVLGLGLGVVLPRFTTIVGTSSVGVLALTTGLAMLASRHLPSLWGSILANTAWFLGGAGLLLVVSLAFQARHGHLREVVSAPAPAAA